MALYHIVKAVRIQPQQTAAVMAIIGLLLLSSVIFCTLTYWSPCIDILCKPNTQLDEIAVNIHERQKVLTSRHNQLIRRVSALDSV